VRRKVIQIAGSTQLVSLPRKWAQKFNIKKGQELEVIEKGSSLLIQTSSRGDAFISEIDLSELDSSVMRFVHAIYKKGADEIRVKVNSQKQLEILHEMIKEDTIGFEIVHQSKDLCVLKAVAEVFENEFNSILRRTFMLMKSMNEGILEILKTRDFSTLQNVRNLEGINNKYTGICRRILNKNGYAESKNLTFVYCTVEELEKMADQHKYLCDTLTSNKNIFKKFDKKTLLLFQKTSNLFDKYYELYYKYDLKKISGNFSERKKIISEAKAILIKGAKSDAIVAHYIISIAQMIANMMSFRVEMSA